MRPIVDEGGFEKYTFATIGRGQCDWLTCIDINKPEMLAYSLLYSHNLSTMDRIKKPYSMGLVIKHLFLRTILLIFKLLIIFI